MVRDLKLKIKIQENNKRANTECFEMATQCNTMGKIISDLKCALDEMICQSEEADLNNNIEFDNYTKEVFSVRKNTKGKMYSEKLREVYYKLRSFKVPLTYIGPIIKSVLQLFDIEIADLPSVTTAANFTNEMGIVSRKQLSETSSSKNVTMHRDATKKKVDIIMA